MNQNQLVHLKVDGKLNKDKFGDALVQYEEERDERPAAIVLGQVCFNELRKWFREDIIPTWNYPFNIVFWGIPVIVQQYHMPFVGNVERLAVIVKTEVTYLDRKICEECTKSNSYARSLLRGGVFECCEFESNLKEPPSECPYLLEHLMVKQC